MNASPAPLAADLPVRRLRRELLLRMLRAASSSSRLAGYAPDERRYGYASRAVYRGRQRYCVTYAPHIRTSSSDDALHTPTRTARSLERRPHRWRRSSLPLRGSRLVPHNGLPLVARRSPLRNPIGRPNPFVLPTGNRRSPLREPNQLRRSASHSLNAYQFPVSVSTGRNAKTSRWSRAPTNVRYHGPPPMPRATRPSGEQHQVKSKAAPTPDRSSPTRSLGQLLRRPWAFSQRVALTVQSDGPAVGGLRAEASPRSFLRIHRPQGNYRRATHSRDACGAPLRR